MLQSSLTQRRNDAAAQWRNAQRCNGNDATAQRNETLSLLFVAPLRRRVKYFSVT